MTVRNEEFHIAVKKGRVVGKRIPKMNGIVRSNLFIRPKEVFIAG